MFNAIPIRISMIFLTENEKSTLKFTWKHKIPQTVKTSLSKKEEGWRYQVYLTLNYTTEP
jgi:hypothetical protein